MADDPQGVPVTPPAAPLPASGGSATPVVDVAALQAQVDETDRELRRVRRENQKLRQRPDGGVAPAPTSLAAPSDADKHQADLAASKAHEAELAAALRQERVGRLTERAALDSHAVYPEVVAGLLAADLEFDADEADHPTNLNTLLAALRRKYPLLFRLASGDGGALGAGVPPGTDMNALIRQAAGRR